MARQLVRDPYSKLGGVASGIGHHFGIDVSLVRLGFVIFTLVTGLGLLIYPLAWMIIPRAQYWPPIAGPAMGRAMSKREIGLGLVVVGVLVALYLGGGAASQIFVPIILIGGGVWLLMQPGADLAEARAATTGVGFSGSAYSAGSQPDFLQDSFQPTPPPLDNGIPPGTPVAPRKSGGGKVAIGLLAFVGVIGALFFSLIATAVVFAGGDGSPITTSSTVYSIDSVDEIPEFIVKDGGEVLVDMSAVDPAEFETPVTLEIDVDFGEVRVIVPEGLVVDVEADAAAGDVQIFDREESGLAVDVRVAEPDAMLFLNIDIGAGEVVVSEG